MNRKMRPLVIAVLVSAGALLSGSRSAQAQEEIASACCQTPKACCCGSYCMIVQGLLYCGSLLTLIPRELAGSELFGHVAGAFTDARPARSGQFSARADGTGVLDEIAETSLAVEQKLLTSMSMASSAPFARHHSVGRPCANGRRLAEPKARRPVTPQKSARSRPNDGCSEPLLASQLPAHTS